MTISLVITTYNKPEFLDICLRAVLCSTYQPDEVIIADDGSDDRTKLCIQKYQSKFKKLIHAWHIDKGYQRSKILNKAISLSQSDYIITIDQDCIIHPKFIKDHLSLAQENFFVAGYRTNVKKKFTEKLIKSNKNPSKHLFLLNSRLNLKNNLRLKVLSKLKLIIDSKSDKTFGCNMSFFRSDFIKVNGFNEEFVGWGPEDSEFAQRLINNGLQRKRVSFLCIVFHLYHEELSRAYEDKNKQILKETIEEGVKKARLGLVKLD